MRSAKTAAFRTTSASQARKPYPLSPRIVRIQRGVRSTAARPTLGLALATVQRRYRISARSASVQDQTGRGRVESERPANTQAMPHEISPAPTAVLTIVDVDMPDSTASRPAASG